MNNDYQNSRDELKELSPLLAGIKKPEAPKMDDAFFESMQASVFDKINQEDTHAQKTKTFSIRPWMSMAAAIALILTAVFFIGQINTSKEDVNLESIAALNDVPDELIESYLQENLDLVDAEMLIDNDIELNTSSEMLPVSDDVLEDYLQDVDADELEMYF